MSARISVQASTAWGARLQLAGLPLEWEAVGETGLSDALMLDVLGNRPAVTEPLERGASLIERFEVAEHLLWNGLLPLQDVSGDFPRGAPASQCVQALRQVASVGAILDGKELRVCLPIPSIGEAALQGRSLRWKVESEYPQAGDVRVTLYGDRERACEIDLLIRVPSWAQAVQLQKNGITCTQSWQGRYLKLEGPWRYGDQVTLRFGIPFRVFRATQEPLRDRPVERAYPGAPVIEDARIFHGSRLLVPVPGRAMGDPDPADTETELPVGVRKDGVILLAPDLTAHESPFERPGDFFFSAEAHPHLLMAKALWGSFFTQPCPTPGHRIRFEPFETAFDRGAG